MLHAGLSGLLLAIGGVLLLGVLTPVMWLSGDGAQFFWIVGLMALSSGFMLWAFRKVGWV